MIFGKINKVSSKKNGYGMEMAPIIATEDVAVTIRRAIEQELQARGFKIGTDALVQISADLIRFYNDHKVGFLSGDAVADLNMAVVVKSKEGGQLYSRQIIAQGLEPNTQLMTGDNAKLALNRALENGMKMLFEDQEFLSALLEASISKPVAYSSGNISINKNNNLNSDITPNCTEGKLCGNTCIVLNKDCHIYSPTPTTINYNPSNYSNSGSVHVKGYYRKDGTYVRSHTRRK